MRYKIVPPSTVAIDIAGAGPLKVLAHDRSFVAPVPEFTVDLADADSFSAPVEFSFPASQLMPVPDDMNAADRMLIMRNMQGSEVLDSKRYPNIAFKGDYSGDWKSGSLSGTLLLRGKPVKVELNCKIERSRSEVVASGQWQGKLTDLGIRPFKALLGAIKLKDWARLHFAARFKPC